MCPGTHRTSCLPGVGPGAGLTRPHPGPGGDTAWALGWGKSLGNQNPNKCTPFWEKLQNDSLITEDPLRYKLKTQRFWNPGAAPSSNLLSPQFVPNRVTR